MNLKRSLLESTIIKHFKKGTLLLEAEKPANESYLVLKGCIRSYLIKDGEERTIEFYTEEQPVSVTNYGKNIPSGQYLVCAEDTTVSVGTPEFEAEMLEKFPKFETVCRIISEIMMTKYQESFTNYKLMTAEDRYVHLRETRPESVAKNTAVPNRQLPGHHARIAEPFAEATREQVNRFLPNVNEMRPLMPLDLHFN